MNRKVVQTEKVSRPKYFVYSTFDGGGFTDINRNIIILVYMFTNERYPYTVKINKNTTYDLMTAEDFERMVLFFEMMNEQGD